MTDSRNLDAFLEEAWQELLDKDDRTSPAEYPEMVLISRDELEEVLKGWSVELVLP